MWFVASIILHNIRALAFIIIIVIATDNIVILEDDERIFTL